MAKFIRQVFGPIHFETRFKPFVEHNKQTLHNYYYIVNNSELYNSYKSDVEIHDVDSLRLTHPWSNGEEIVFDEPDLIKHIQNFRKFCYDQEKFYLLPVNVLRFGIKDLAERNIKNICFIGNNVFMTDKQEIIDDYFSSIPAGTFHMPFIGVENDPVPCIIHDHLYDVLHEKFPNIIFPKTHNYIEGFQFGAHFRTVDDMMLFYEIWDFIVEQYYIDSKNNWFNIMGGNALGYTRFDDILGYVTKIFEVNFGYESVGFLKYWNNSALGFHLTTPHDTWYYAGGLPSWNLLPPTDNDNIQTVDEYVKKYKNELILYFNNHCTHCNFNITDDGKVNITHKNL